MIAYAVDFIRRVIFHSAKEGVILPKQKKMLLLVLFLVLVIGTHIFSGKVLADTVSDIPLSENTGISEVLSDEEAERPTESVTGNESESDSTDSSRSDLYTEDKADDEVENANKRYLARVGEHTYSTLEEAIAAIETSGTVTLIDDIWTAASIVIPTGKDITLTDDGFKRTVTKSEFDNVNPLFIIEKNATLTIAGTSDDHLIFEQDQMVGVFKDFKDKGNLFHNNGVLNLQAGTLRPGGFDSKAQFSGAIHIGNHAVFHMSGGIIEDMNAYDSWYTSPVFVASGGLFHLSGGEIRNNKNTWDKFGQCSGGGGVLLFAWNANDPLAVMHMTGGTITGNSAKYGGGVYMTGRTQFILSGGTIAKNKAFNGDGGGVCVAARSGVDHPNETEFVMNGGSIIGNKAKNGGGIYVNSDKVYLNAGYIEENIAAPNEHKTWSGHGGGVYVSEVPRILYIGKAVITANKAVASSEFYDTSGMGGGLWACPTGSISFKVTNGVAIFDNIAQGDNTAGDDVVKVELPGKGPGLVTLPDRMLGGGAVKWYRDGQVISGQVGRVDAQSPRYSLEQPGEVLHLLNHATNLAAKAVVGKNAAKRALEEATLFIRNNVAAHGGGIGTNGDITMPEHDVPDWHLKIYKEWDPEVKDRDKKEVEIFLRINDTVLDSILLNAENGWQGEFTDLPSPDSLKGKKINVIEGERVPQKDGTILIKETSKWHVTYRELKEDEFVLSFKITNKNKPKEPPHTPPDNPPERPPYNPPERPPHNPPEQPPVLKEPPEQPPVPKAPEVLMEPPHVQMPDIKAQPGKQVPKTGVGDHSMDWILLCFMAVSLLNRRVYLV